MNILAINSSKKQAEISLYCGNNFFCFKMDETKSHSEFLLQEIENFLLEHGLTIQQIDAECVNVGPGSFTGIRIGISFVKAFMLSLKSKAIIVNNFELVEFNIKQKPKSYYVVLNSNNEDFYFQKTTEKGVEFGFINKQNLNEIIKKTNENVYCNNLEKEFFDGILNLKPVEIDDFSQIKIAKQKADSENFVSIVQLNPLYIKKSQAEIGLFEKINKNLEISSNVMLKNLVCLEEKCFENPYSENLLNEDLINKNRHLFFAYFGGEVVGYINFEEVCDELNLLRICVLPEFREYGIATKLMQKMFDYFNENDVLTKIFLEVDAKNFSAIKLYEKFGFQKIDVRKNYYENNSDALVFKFEK